MIDAVVVGAGPNGLAAAIELARAGFSVQVFEASAEVGGGARSAELTLPGFVHDVCSSVFPMAVVAPFFRSLEKHIDWLYPRVSVAHAFDDGTAAVIALDGARTADSLGVDADAFANAAHLTHDLWPDLLAPLHIPKHPWSFARFGLAGARSALGYARAHFRSERARALFAGCAAHSFLPLSSPLTAAVGLVFTATAAAPGWPFARGGAASITNALADVARGLGVTITTSTRVDSLPTARVTLFDTSPRELARIAGAHLPSHFRERLEHFRYGPAAFKLDWALDAAITWRAADLRDAGVVHVGSLDEIAASEASVSAGRMPDAPFFLIAQPTIVDATRAPAGRHIAWAYAHVPHGWRGDDDALVDDIESRIERMAPGFKDAVLARSTMPPAALERYNASYVGGHVIGGVADWRQMFARPVSATAPYATPNRSIFLCSSSTPPGGGVHGMCGFHAARHARCRLIEADSNQRGLVMEFVIAFIGLCLLVAPWVVGYGYGTMWSPPAIWCSVILGAIILLVAGYRALARDRATWEDWVAGVCGVLAIVAPFVFGFTTPAMWTSVILGVIAAVLAGIQLFGTTPGAGTPAPRAT